MKSPLDRLFDGETALLVIGPGGEPCVEPPPQDAVVLAASFNPLHIGHRRLLEAAAGITGRDPYFELSIVNADKARVSRDELDERLRQFSPGDGVIVTRAPTFEEKAELMPGSVFVLGVDTAIRLFEERFYPDYDPTDDPRGLGSGAAVALDRVRAQGCSFLVAGRVDSGGNFVMLDDIKVPAEFRDMFAAVPEEQFREDISSTELRKKQAREHPRAEERE